MAEHEHDFEPATIVPIFGGTAVAWVPTRVVSPSVPTEHAWLCACGEQGYEVRA